MFQLLQVLARKRQRARDRPVVRICPSKLCPQWPNQDPPLSSTFTYELINRVTHCWGQFSHEIIFFKKPSFWTHETFDGHFWCKPQKLVTLILNKMPSAKFLYYKVTISFGNYFLVGIYPIPHRLSLTCFSIYWCFFAKLIIITAKYWFF